MEFRILGPLEIDHDHQPIVLSSPREQRLLAMLLLAAGRVVPLESLVDAVWNGRPPASAKRQVQNRMSALRRRLDHTGALIVADGPGYRIRVGDDQLDSARFYDLVGRARTLPADRNAEAADLLRSALALWRGPALAGLTGWAIEVAAARLEERRLTAFEQYVERELALGNHTDLIGELAETVAAHPTRERLVGRLMLALHQCARRADALSVYEELRHRLAEDLGVDPSPELQRLYTAILRNQPVGNGDRPATSVQPHGHAGPIPRQLPAGPFHFVGRGPELDVLDRLATARETATGTVIAAIGGTAGVGKTALALYWAHQVADRFPDGQLFVSLRGFAPGDSPLSPVEAIGGILGALGIPPPNIPAGLDSRAALYRSLLAGRRMLLVLDNARDTGQIRPLLPGSPTCMVVVTSRNQLTGLISANGANPVDLDLLATGEARQLLVQRLGQTRIDAEPQAVDDIIRYCSRLPLALVVAAGRAATHAGFPLAAMADELRDLRSRLNVLTDEDAVSDTRSVFSSSYLTLHSDAARLFRQLALHPGPDIAELAAASLAGVPAPQAKRRLAELARACLIVEHRPARFGWHDLLRAYADELSRTTDSGDNRRAAALRLLDYYLHTAYRGALLLEPYREPLALSPPLPGVTPADLSDHDAALGWFTVEQPALVDLVGLAIEVGADTHAWQLAWSVLDYLDRRGLWLDCTAVQQAALAAADRLGDRSAQASAYRGLARADIKLGRKSDAHRHLQCALDLYHGLGDQAGQAAVHNNLGVILAQEGRLVEALHHAHQTHDLFAAAGRRPGQAAALNAVGWFHAKLGQYQEALRYCRQALVLHREIGDPPGEAAAWDSLGYAQYHLGRYRSAGSCYREALTRYELLGDTYSQAVVLNRLGETNRTAGDLTAARQAWERALQIFEQLHHSTSADVRAKLDRLAPKA